MSVTDSTAPRADTRKRERVAPGVYLRAGKYQIAYKEPGGRYVIKTIAARTKTQAIAEREKRRVDVRSGEGVDSSDATLGDVGRDFLDTFEGLVLAGERSERTLELYRQRWRTHIEPRLGRLKVQAVRAGHVSRLLAELRRAELAPWTTQGIYTLLSSVFQHALARGYIATSPLQRLSRSERPKGRALKAKRILTNQECQRLIHAAWPTWRPVVAAYVFTGARLSEVLGLTWEDVDFESGILRVRFQLGRASGARPAKRVSLKTGAGERDIILLPEFTSMLRKHRMASRFSGDADFVFCTSEGKPLGQRNASRAFAKAAERSGVTASPHVLRHTHASRLIASGLDVVVVQRQLGHSKPSTTLDVYSREFEAQRRTEDIRTKIAATEVGAVLAEGAS
jgi:integrase